MKQVVIAGAVRTPIGKLNGVLSHLSATVLGSIVIGEARNSAKVHRETVDEVIMGNVLAAGLGQAPASQAAIGAGIPHTVDAATINKVCGSSLKSVMMADQAVQAGEAEIVVAGGMESMTGSPYLLEKAREGYRVGHGELMDSMIKDGLWDLYGKFSMGTCGELCAEKFRFSREAQDDFAVESYDSAGKDQRAGCFREEIVEVEVPAKRKPLCVGEDEELERFDEAKMRRLKPAFRPEGIMTVGNASGMNDGAAAMVLLSEERAEALSLTPIARIVGYAEKAVAPEWFTIAPIEAMQPF